METLDLDTGDRCHYALGEAMFVGLWRELGEEEFSEDAEELYLKPGPRGIDQVRTAFGYAQAVERWYRGQGKLSNNP